MNFSPANCAAGTWWTPPRWWNAFTRVSVFNYSVHKYINNKCKLVKRDLGRHPDPFE